MKIGSSALTLLLLILFLIGPFVIIVAASLLAGVSFVGVCHSLFDWNSIPSGFPSLRFSPTTQKCG